MKTLEIVRKLGERKLQVKRMYRKIRDRELFIAAYGKLYANQGALTPGVDPADTVDGMSLKRIDRIIEQLAQGTYRWKPVRRVYIPKRNGQFRPLGLPGWNDKMVQEVIRMVLEAYYEPRFSPYSHGYRPGRGCHTALDQIRRHWRGVKWFIEVDIKGCFDNLNHQLILNLIERDIPDQRFLKLLQTMLQAGYVEDWQYHRTYSGAPQGGIISPLLSNIVLHELDRYVEEELLPEYNRGEYRKLNPPYNSLVKKMSRAKKAGAIKSYRMMRKQLRQMPSGDTHDEDYRRLKYVRYADDVLLGFAGPKAEAIEIKQKIQAALERLKLEMSDQKTLITHAASEQARFLGYDLSVMWCDSRLFQDRATTTKVRHLNGEIRLSVPREIVTRWQNRYARKGKSIHRAELLNNSDYEIVMLYNMEFQGMVNYYALAQNASHCLYRVKYAYMQSLVKTLAYKHRRKIGWVYAQYKVKFDTGVIGLMVTVPRKEPQKPLIAKFGAKPIRYNENATLVDDIRRPYTGHNELTQRMLAEECELCGSHDSIEVHHIHKLANIRKRYQGRKDPPTWAVRMMKRNRKTLVVCHECHQAIHKGEHNGQKLT